MENWNPGAEESGEFESRESQIYFKIHQCLQKLSVYISVKLLISCLYHWLKKKSLIKLGKEKSS